MSRKKHHFKRKNKKNTVSQSVSTSTKANLSTASLQMRTNDVNDEASTLLKDPATFIKKIANNVWKLQAKMLDTNGSPIEGFERLYRFVEALEDALHDVGVEIKSHNGEVYDTGMAVNVVAWEKRTDSTREEIIETIKPTIRLGNHLIQWADVIATTPENESKESTTALNQTVIRTFNIHPFSSPTLTQTF